VRIIPNLLLFLTLILSNTALSQVKYGLTFQGGLSILKPSRTATVKYLYDMHPAYSYKPNLMRPNSVWHTNEFLFSIYPTSKIDFGMSIGLRMFHFSWKTDSVGYSAYYGSLHPIANGTWKAFYGQRVLHYGYLLPTLGFSYGHKLGGDFRMKYSANFGIFSFVDKHWQKTTAYGDGQDGFDYQDQGYEKPGYDLEYDSRTFDLKLSSMLYYNINKLSLFVGASYYHFKLSYFRHDGLILDAGIEIHFKKREKTKKNKQIVIPIDSN
jgi:hypothetical protein